MKKRRCSPKQIRQEQWTTGIITGLEDFSLSGSMFLGIEVGDQILIANSTPPVSKLQRVHVARRRLAAARGQPKQWIVKNVSSTSFEIEPSQ